jgi:hypothetical protein
MDSTHAQKYVPLEAKCNQQRTEKQKRYPDERHDGGIFSTGLEVTMMMLSMCQQAQSGFVLQEPIDPYRSKEIRADVQSHQGKHRSIRPNCASVSMVTGKDNKLTYKIRASGQRTCAACELQQMYRGAVAYNSQMCSQSVG